MYREERGKLDAAQLTARLNSTDLGTPVETSSVEITDIVPGIAERKEELLANGIAATKHSNGTSLSQPSEPISADIEPESELFGNLLDEMPLSEVNDTGSTIPVRDMGLPKHFSGKSPKVNLEETVRKVDKYATVVFRVISASRAVRASVSIRWDGGRTQGFEMQEVACWDQAQAFNYIATVALFEVSSTAVNKQLPILFRDLWDELVLKRKEEDDENYRERLKLFKAIAEPRLQPIPSRVSRLNQYL